MTGIVSNYLDLPGSEVNMDLKFDGSEGKKNQFDDKNKNHRSLENKSDFGILSFAGNMEGTSNDKFFDNPHSGSNL